MLCDMRILWKNGFRVKANLYPWKIRQRSASSPKEYYKDQDTNGIKGEEARGPDSLKEGIQKSMTSLLLLLTNFLTLDPERNKYKKIGQRSRSRYKLKIIPYTYHTKTSIRLSSILFVSKAKTAMKMVNWSKKLKMSATPA
jgi:hypothetical protein